MLMDTTQVLWRWREYLAPKPFIGLYQGNSREAADKAAAEAGRLQASRVYEVSIDGGATWHSAPADMPVIDIEGNPMPEERRRNGRPSDAASRAIDRGLK